MASVSMAMPLSSAIQKRVNQPSSESFIKPLPLKQSKGIIISTNPKSRARVQVQASFKEKAVTGLTAAALTASMVIPSVAEAAESGVSPSLKNFLLSIVAGGVVLTAIIGAVIGVANFDPVKRA
ncbi:Photosystem II PsbX [Corchorus capsularis]|uniref:Photosystem II PsbX n=1 Tax=Corchorus capsularis TaxID=210143 RepID=A0A1R3H9S2_COCAP|nr:Photosystem II PsbX [Corchorus capsularis]